MSFTDEADSATTIAATQIKHCLICRHKGFPFAKILTYIKMPRTWPPFFQFVLHLTGELCTFFLKFCVQCILIML